MKVLTQVLILIAFVSGCGKLTQPPIQGKILYHCTDYEPLPNKPWTSWGLCIYENGQIIRGFPHTIVGVWAGKDRIYHHLRALPNNPPTSKGVDEFVISHYKTKEIDERIHYDFQDEFSPEYFFKNGEEILGKIYEKVGEATVTNIAIYNKKTRSLTKVTGFKEPGNLLGSISMSPSEDRIVYSFSLGLSEPNQIYMIDLKGNVLEKIDGARDPDWSPDGTKLVYTYGDLFIHDLIAKETKEIAEFDEIIATPRFSPDGKQIVFIIWGGQGTKKNVAVINADGKGFRRLLSEKDAGAGVSEPYWQAYWQA